MMIKNLSVILAMLAAIVGTPAAAQRTQSIAAIVNDDIISVFDLNTRMQMVIVSSNLKDSRKVRERLAPQVLRGLIDERIRLQEAKRRNVTASKSNMRRALVSIAKQNKVTPKNLKKYFKEQGIPLDTLLSQVRSQIAWSKLVNRRLRPRISISEEEISEVLQRIKSREGQTEYRIAEIFLGLNSLEQEAELRRGARRLVEQLRAGALFSSVARQFSQSTSAASGGDLGWSHETEMESDLKPVVAKMKPGEISDPLYSISGFRIIKLIGTRQVAAGDAGDAKLTLRQIFLPLAPKSSNEAIDERMQHARTLAATVSGCAEMTKMAKEVKSAPSPDLGTFRLRDLSSKIRSAVGGLPVGKASAPIRSRTGIMILMVCRRDEPKASLPTRKAIEDQLINRRLNLMARRYMRDLRNAAVVDLRR